MFRFFAFGLLLVPTVAFAAGQTALTNATIKIISAYNTDMAFVKTEPVSASTVSNCLAAGSGYTGEWAIPLNTDSGKAMYALILNAATQGKKINIYGGSIGCTLINNRETVVRIDVAY